MKTLLGQQALTALEGAIEGVIIVRKDNGQIMYVNRSAGRMFGYSPKEMRGLAFRVLHPAEDYANIMESFDAFRRGDVKLATAVPCLRRDGSRFWSDISSIGMVVAGVPCLIGFFSDISGQKEARDSSAEAQTLFASVFNAVPDVLGIQDTKHGIIRYNEAGYRFLNVDAESVQGRKCYELIGRNAPCDHCATSETYRTKKPAQLEKFVESMGIWLDVRSYPIFDTQGNLKGIVEHLRDITLQKRAEAELLKTEKLSSLAILAGGIAHDFNNLLAGIYGNLDMARSVSRSPQVNEFLDATIKTMGRARALTQQLLTFAKGGVPVRRVARLDDFLNETAKFAFSGSRISWALDIEEGLWACNYDPDQMGQVIDNVLINAQQAMPLGGRVTMTAANVTLKENEDSTLASGRYVRISIRDSGVGISAEHLSRIFDPFFTTKQQGSGLGLATSFSIIQQHGGAIRAESDLEKGSTFYVFLPACALKEESGPVSEPEPLRGQGRILIMDDEEMLRDIIGAVLRNQGYQVVGATDGAEALRLFDAGLSQGEGFAAVILDLTIPGGMGGKDVIGELRKRDREVPIFVSSGYADDPILARPQEFGFTASLIKPFTSQSLLALLGRYLPGSSIDPRPQ
ncbi:MAG TPA: PAS domain S-box protein [Candidatus Binatia bacterium]|nr:PAS domain S-box protein [Candidatus Binatia bacterium]